MHLSLYTIHRSLINIMRIPGRLSIIIALLLLSFAGYSQWKPVGDKIATEWKSKVTPDNAWQEYPRPQLVRTAWQNLNGLWEYAIRPKGESKPRVFDGKILVPFCVESSLSGVGKPLLPTQELWYKKQISLPSNWNGKNIILHFGAVDYKTSVYLDDKLVGEHTGSSDPFSFDITAYLNGRPQELIVKVWDPTDSETQPRGKQVLKPVGFWYTAVSGIWQTVWLEPVAKTRIYSLNPVANIDDQSVDLVSQLENPQGNERLKVSVFRKGKMVLETDELYKPSIGLKIPKPELWTPASPALYDLKVEVTRDGKLLDQFSSYFAMRKISLGKDLNGDVKLMLNNEPLFQWGVLDQGWWPESLLTPPTDEALKYDMEVLKRLGFNMIRKHIKVEPARFYFHADTMGLLVWQDMPSGFVRSDPKQHVSFDAELDWDRPDESARTFEQEWKSIMDNLRFFPSIVVWVPFNEGWGQYDSERISAWTENYDKTRLVNATSGWTDRKVGTMFDAHQYPGPSMEPGIQNPGRAMVLGEFGGLGWPVKGHIWDAGRNNWGYRTFLSESDYTRAYSKVIRNVYPLISRGLAAAIYTQTSDVEAEVNGLLTYDRKRLKVDEAEAIALHSKLYEKYSKAEFLVPDSEISPSNLYTSSTQPGHGWHVRAAAADFKPSVGPLKLKKGDSIWAVNKFTLSHKDNLAMKIYAQGQLKIYLNGSLVYENEILTKRHYDELNLSEFSEKMKRGENTIALELKNATADSEFDFGLYKFGNQH